MYKLFKDVLFRSPSLSFNKLNNGNIGDLLTNKQIQEAIYLASADLYRELQKYLKGEIVDTKERERLRNSLMRYFSRMSTRCTPFGLFAGCTIGSISDATQVQLTKKIDRYTRLDMSFLCALSQTLSNIPEIKSKLRYYPNNSIYTLGKRYRYIEYKYLKDRRIHHISAIKKTDYLRLILNKAKEGVLIENLVENLICQEITRDEALVYINDLIDSQILVSELDPFVTGDDLLSQIISIIEPLVPTSTLLEDLKKVQVILNELDIQINDTQFLYQQIIALINKWQIPYTEKYLFQVDVNNKASVATLGKDITNELHSTMLFLNKINISEQYENLTNFKDAFSARYEDREIPLLHALDPEIGIGYPVGKTGNLNPILKNLALPQRINSTNIYRSKHLQSVLLKKTIEVSSNNKKEITLSDDDFKDAEGNWNDLPKTMYTKIEILRSGENDSLIKMNFTGGSCGANLLGRFAHTDTRIGKFVKDIANKEQELELDALLAEIVHLPDSRVGNILFRPHIRKYELVYLSNSSLPIEKQIYTSDLLLSVKQGRLCLKSKRLNREIIPRLTTAHNYHSSSIPVYQFLCDMQNQTERRGLFFSWGYLEQELVFRPRVRYKNTILSSATWNIKIEELKPLFSLKGEKLMEKITDWREKKSLPQYLLLLDGDNELFVDSKNENSLQAFFSVVKNRSAIQLEEFLFEEENAIIRDKDGNPYLNECIVAFYRN